MLSLRSYWKQSNADPEFLGHCRDLCRVWRVSCFVCGKRDGTVVPHHVHAKRRFGDKNNIVCIDSVCHGLIHDRGYEWFEKHTGVSLADFEAEARRLYAKFREIWQDEGGECRSDAGNYGVGPGRLNPPPLLSQQGEPNMADDKKKTRTRRAGAVRVTLTFSDEEKLAIGGGAKADNAALSAWVEDQIVSARQQEVKRHLQARLAEIDVLLKAQDGLR